MPVSVLIFPFVKDLKAKRSVTESFSQFLPGNFLANILKDTGKVSLVVGVIAAF